MLERKGLTIPPWVGVTRIGEGDAIPDGLAYTIYPEAIYLRFQFLRLIGFKVSIGLVPAIATRFKILRLGRVPAFAWETVHGSPKEPSDQQMAWGWRKVLEIQLKGARL